MRLSGILLLAILSFAWAVPATAAEDQVARGRYLATLGDCSGCHTPPHQPPFSGGKPFKAIFGTVYSTNITPDPETGIGKWTRQDFYRALHEGIARGGKHLYPAFPYVYFQHISREDTDALFAFLRTVKPVHKPPTPNKLIFPANLRFGLIFWNWLFFDKTNLAVPANASAAWARGDYLVNGLGHCAACHTPKNLLFGDKKDKPLAGGTVEHWFAANLTESKSGGLKRWRQQDIVNFLAKGRSRFATAAGSMLEKVVSSTSHMRQADLDAIAVYLKSLPPENPMRWEAPRHEQMDRGQGLYRAHCQGCHGMNGEARTHNDLSYPKLAGDTLVEGHDPTTVLRIMLEGGAAPRLPGDPPAKPMPSFKRLNDGEIADLASYVRNSWGNQAPPVSATAVRILRRALKD